MGIIVTIILLVLPLSAHADSFLLTSGSFDFEFGSFSGRADLAGPQVVMKERIKARFTRTFSVGERGH